MKITEFNAYRFSDNWTIESNDGLKVLGCEHNQQEAEALAKWATDYHGCPYIAKWNGPDAVRQAKQFRSNPFRFTGREAVFKEMGLIQ